MQFDLYNNDIYSFYISPIGKGFFGCTLGPGLY